MTSYSGSVVVTTPPPCKDPKKTGSGSSGTPTDTTGNSNSHTYNKKIGESPGHVRTAIGIHWKIGVSSATLTTLIVSSGSIGKWSVSSVVDL